MKYIIFTLILFIPGTKYYTQNNQESVQVSQEYLFQLQESMDKAEVLHGRSLDAISILLATISLIVGIGAVIGYLNIKDLNNRIKEGGILIDKSLNKMEHTSKKFEEFMTEKVELIEKSKSDIDKFKESYQKELRHMEDVIISITSALSGMNLALIDSSSLSHKAKQKMNQNLEQYESLMRVYSAEVDVVFKALAALKDIGDIEIAAYLEEFEEFRMFIFESDNSFLDLKKAVKEAIFEIKYRGRN